LVGTATSLAGELGMVYRLVVTETLEYRVPRPESMSFTDAIKVCFTKYADFHGCASRPEFWWWVLFTFVASAALGVFDQNLSLAFTLATLLPGSAVTTRRLHDTDRSGYWQLIWLIPIIGWILLVIWCAQVGTPNRYRT
jgi:uncharacterized membrane protein YhaH (DUF805 family)